MNGGIIYFNTSTLSTQYSGACNILWSGTGTASSMDWYGIGMNGGQFVYNVPTRQMHSFQVNGTQAAYVNSGSLVAQSGTIAIGSLQLQHIVMSLQEGT